MYPTINNFSQADYIAPGADTEPSWGPVGSLLRERDPELYAQLEAQDAERNATAAFRVTRHASVTRKCARCGGEFEPARANHRYCSDACRQAGHRSRR